LSQRNEESATVKPVEVVPARRVLGLNQAAEYLGVSYWTMRDLVQAGTIPTVKIPSARAGDGRAIRRILVDIHDLDVFISGNKERQN
jgi:excisionase family DNA binding protein